MNSGSGSELAHNGGRGLQRDKEHRETKNTEKYGMTETSVYSLVKEHLELFSGHGVVPLERLLLPETSGTIQDMFKDLLKKPVEEPGLGSTGVEPPVEAEASGQSEKSGKKGETK